MTTAVASPPLTSRFDLRKNFSPTKLGAINHVFEVPTPNGDEGTNAVLGHCSVRITPDPDDVEQAQAAYILMGLLIPYYGFHVDVYLNIVHDNEPILIVTLSGVFDGDGRTPTEAARLPVGELDLEGEFERREWHHAEAPELADVPTWNFLLSRAVEVLPHLYKKKHQLPHGQLSVCKLMGIEETV